MKTESRRGVLLLMAAFALRGIFLDLALPYGDPLDEVFHFGYAVFLESTGRPPRAAEISMPGELLRPLQFLPGSAFPPGPRLSWSEAARLTAADSERRWREAFPVPSDARPLFVTVNYESQQPPLFYLGAAFLLRPLTGFPMSARLLALRLAATFVAVLAVPLIHGFFRRILPRRAAFLATAAWVAFPGVGSFVGRFTNDALVLPVVAGLLVLFADTARGRLFWRQALLLAGLLALGCWTKLYILLLIPAAPLAAMLAPLPRRRMVAMRALAAGVVALLLISPWLLRQRADTGDWLGLTASKQAASLGVSLSDRVRSLPSLVAPRFWIVFGRTFLWPGTWSAMGAPASAAVVLVLSLVLILLSPTLRRTPRSSSRGRVSRAAAIALLLFIAGQLSYASTYAAVARLQGHIPSAGPDGWFLLVLLPAILSLGCAAGRRIPRPILLTAAGLFLLCDWAMILGVLPSVYGGSTLPNGSNAPIAAWAPMMVSPLLGLATYSRLGLAHAPIALLGGILASGFLAFFAAMSLALRHPLPRGQ